VIHLKDRITKLTLLDYLLLNASSKNTPCLNVETKYCSNLHATRMLQFSKKKKNTKKTNKQTIKQTNKQTTTTS